VHQVDVRTLLDGRRLDYRLITAHDMLGSMDADTD
jgi:hypothetical protein